MNRRISSGTNYLKLRTKGKSFAKGEQKLARHRDAVCRLCVGKGRSCCFEGACDAITDKCAMRSATLYRVSMGSHGERKCGYGLQLREKQKAKRTYGLP